MKKSPIDNLFFELYGYYPNKAGTAYELIVAAALKIVTGESFKYDQRLIGNYSETNYQIDVLNEDKKQITEAKDYTIRNKKVGRSDIQKLQGALSDLDIKKGLFASATDYTKPSRKYSDSSTINPLQKEIELYHIRPSTKSDEKGRIVKFVIDIVMVIADFDNGDMQFIFTDSTIESFKKLKLIGKNSNIIVDKFYTKEGKFDCLVEEFIEKNQPISKIDDKFGVGCWLLHDKYILYEENLYELKGVTYKIPYKKQASTFSIDVQGEPKILVKSEDGKINKLLTDSEFKKLTFKEGLVK